MKRLVILVVAASACRTRPPDTLAQRDVATVTPPAGAVSAKLIPDPDSPTVQLAPGEEFVPPQLDRSNKPPAYPPDLVALHLPAHTIALRVFFDEYGRAYDIKPSPVANSSPIDDHTAAFERAARDALASWKCYPPSIRKFRPGPDLDGDGKPDYRILAAQRVLKTFFDVSFTFEVVNGVPVVRVK